ncbi:MAG: hypothetical protein ACOX1P_04235 [Thermoguttaceae bacterium]|jgi:hypothetical protein
MTRLLYRFSVSLFMLALGASYLDAADIIPGRWPAEKVNRWYANQPWPVGCNYIPSTAINQIETWQAESFDPETIDRELGLAESIGFNTVRMFSHDLVWEADPEGFKDRVRKVLDLCEKHNIRLIFNPSHPAPRTDRSDQFRAGGGQDEHPIPLGQQGGFTGTGDLVPRYLPPRRDPV